jgi:hypothetical protein
LVVCALGSCVLSEWLAGFNVLVGDSWMRTDARVSRHAIGELTHPRKTLCWKFDATKEICWSHGAVMTGRVMLGMVVSKDFGTWPPIDEEMLLTDAVFDPVEAHVDGFGPSLFDGVDGKSCGGGIVSLQWRGWLWMA